MNATPPVRCGFCLTPRRVVSLMFALSLLHGCSGPRENAADSARRARQMRDVSRMLDAMENAPAAGRRAVWPERAHRRRAIAQGCHCGRDHARLWHGWFRGLLAACAIACSSAIAILLRRRRRPASLRQCRHRRSSPCLPSTPPPRPSRPRHQNTRMGLRGFVLRNAVAVYRPRARRPARDPEATPLHCQAPCCCSYRPSMQPPHCIWSATRGFRKSDAWAKAAQVSTPGAPSSTRRRRR